MGGILPTGHQLAGAGGTVLVCLLFLLLGGLVARRAAPEIRLLAGWGLASLVLTAWGALTGPVSGIDLRIALAGLVAAAIAGLFLGGGRNWSGLGRTLALGLPFLAVLLPMAPSQFDTWINLLPKAAYLADYHRFPAQGLPESWSFIPVAPYTTQFIAWIASLAAGAFAETAMGMFNAVLLLAAGLLIGRVLSASGDDATPPWWSIALGLLIAAPLNPGFSPRVFLAPYGETGLAVTCLASAWLAARAVLAARERGVAAPDLSSLAWVLVAMVNIKQSGIGLVLAAGIAWLIALLLARPAQTRRAVSHWLATMLPAIALYLLWRWYVYSHMPGGELEPRRFADWNWPILPGILAAIAWAIFTRPFIYLLTLALIGLGIRHWRQAGREQVPTFWVIAGLICLGQVGFLVFTYIAHFPPDWALRAHSFFRYFSQTSLALMLGLALAFRPFVARYLMTSWRSHLAGSLILIILLGPLLAWPVLRVDRQIPQPQLAELGSLAAAAIRENDRVAILTPGATDDAAASFLRGMVMFMPPRVRPAGFLAESTATDSALANARQDGATLAIISCAPAGLAGIAPREGGVLRWKDGGWAVEARIAWPPELRRRAFAGLIPPATLCME